KLPSIIEIKKAIPAHCFESNTLRSIYSLVKDFVIVGLLCLLVEGTWMKSFTDVLFISPQFVITPMYWFVQGTLFVAIFIIGHDTGHSSFSKHEIVNTIFGNICHTFLFCPYYMWKISHRKHHMHTCNMDRDRVFYPVRKKDRVDGLPLIKGFALGFGWFAYLIQGYKPRGVSHFNPLDPLFRHHVANCIISLVCLFLWSMCLARLQEAFGLGALVYHWGVPTFVFASYMVIITFLQHTEENTPWYSDDVWENLRGQLSTVDRHYGWCHEIIHSIGTHQIHHLFPKVPYYHLEEATVAFRKAFPELVNVSVEPIIPAFLRMFQKYATQNVVENNTQVHIYK
ncbi:unnamed protein product, partial [Lymnaea stagnalis]